jgi:ring-1,2-phenylacetyl-CoA epoxidase subunit PaaD
VVSGLHTPDRATSEGATRLARRIVDGVEDPELPHVTIGELGMVRSVDVVGATARVTLTPTYTGCPATEQIRDDVASALAAEDFESEIRFAMSPAWTTDWITPTGRAKLRAAGIAPPHPAGPGHETRLDLPVRCPRCSSRQTRRIAEFGSTACKSSMACAACGEPFEQFKAL